MFAGDDDETGGDDRPLLDEVFPAYTAPPPLPPEEPLVPPVQRAGGFLLDRDHGTARQILAIVREEAQCRTSSKESAERRKKKEDDRVTFDIPTDAYGAAILAIVRDFQMVLLGRDAAFFLLQSVVSMGLIVVNLILQLGMVYFIKTTIVGRKIFEVQREYARFHEAVFDSQGILQADLWDEFPDKSRLCEVGPSNHLFYYVTLFIWIMNMLKELRKCFLLVADIHSVPLCQDQRDMLEEELGDPGEASEISIVALTRPVKLAMYILVCFPKTFICLVLMKEGMEWLTATTKFEDLVMNAVAMGFVLNIDELLYQVILPEEKKTEVEDIDFKLPAQNCSAEEEKRRDKAVMRNDYRDSSFYVIFAVLFVYVYSHFLQNVLPASIDDVRKVCGVWMRGKSPICTNSVLKHDMHQVFAWMSLSFPGKILDWPAESFEAGGCYPYGREDS